MFLQNLFGKKKSRIPVFTDIHSHLLPGIDDGVKTMGEAVDVIKVLADQGFTKLITTPHIMKDYYKNTPEIIRSKLIEVQQELKSQQINVKLEAAAEYYLDEHFYKSILDENELLSFGDKNYVLFETSFTVEPLILKEALFKLNASGYTPVFAHPERYSYLHQNKSLLSELIDQGLLFQLNMLSLTDYYGTGVTNMAKQLIKRKAVAFVGSDCHNQLMAQKLTEAYHSKWAHQLQIDELLNHEI